MKIRFSNGVDEAGGQQQRTKFCMQNRLPGLVEENKGKNYPAGRVESGQGGANHDSQVDDSGHEERVQGLTKPPDQTATPSLGWIMPRKSKIYIPNNKISAVKIVRANERKENQRCESEYVENSPVVDSHLKRK